MWFIPLVFNNTWGKSLLKCCLLENLKIILEGVINATMTTSYFLRVRPKKERLYIHKGNIFNIHHNNKSRYFERECIHIHLNKWMTINDTLRIDYICIKVRFKRECKLYHMVIYIKGNSIALKMLIISNQNFLPSSWILFL